jgi:hypothetical protein
MNMENGPHLVVTDPTVLDMLFSQNASHFDLFFQEPIFANLRFGLKLFGQFAASNFGQISIRKQQTQV